MGWFGKQLLKVIEWEDNSSDTIVYKFPMDAKAEIMMGSKLTVRESQLAVFVNKGKIADIFEPGYYKLETSNLPILTSIFSWKYGFNSPFKAEVYFVNTKQFINQKWGTTNPIPMRDPDFGVVRVRGFGKYSYKVGDAATFLRELFGTSDMFTTSDISEYLKSFLVSGLADAIGESKVGVIDLASNYLEFNNAIRGVMQEKFNSIGLVLREFIIENISVPPEVEQEIDTRSKLGILGDKMGSYMQYQAANAMRDSANNPNGNNPFANAGLGFGAGNAYAGMMMNSFQTAQDTNPNTNQIQCGVCGAVIGANAKFCPECGKDPNVQNDADGVACPKCGAMLKPTAKFCPECGEKTSSCCPKCNAKIKPGVKFCPECGEKLT